MSEIAAFLASQRDRQAALLTALVRLPTDNPPGDLAAAAEATGALLEELGFEVEHHPVPAEDCARVGMTSCTNLVIRHRFSPGPTIALNAHGDVVPPGEGWSQEPYGAAIVDGWMYGRGAAVSKSDIATYAFALRALIETRTPLKGAIELHVTFDEETGGEIGPLRLLEEGTSKPDYAIAAGFSYAVVNAHNGCLHLEVELRGRSAHAAKPWTGVDALEAATAVLAALYASRPSLATRISGVAGIGAPQLTIGLIEGGINTNVVPDRTVFRLDRRLVPEENPVEVEAELNALIANAVGAFPDAQCTVRRILLATPLTPLPGSERLATTLAAQATRILGTEVGVSGVPLYTDARHYAAHGIPIVLYGAGPRSIEEANAHRADERLPMADLYAATEVIAEALAELLA